MAAADLNEAKNSINSIQSKIKDRQPKISSLSSIYDSTKNIISVLDEYIRSIRAKGTEYTQICFQISEKLSNNNIFDKNSKQLIIKETSLSEIGDSCSDCEIKIDQAKKEIQMILNDINSEKKYITDEEISTNSLKNTLSQLQIELENLSNQMTKRSDQLQQIKEDFDALATQEKNKNQQISDLQVSINDSDNYIKKLDQEVTLAKHSIEEKSYTKLNTHKETLDYERSSIPIKQNLMEMTDKCSKIKSLIDQKRSEEQKTTAEIELITKNVHECKLINSENEAKHQNEVMIEARLKGESQANSYRLSEAEKSSFQVENEYKSAKDELENLKTNEIELRSSFVQKMGEAQHLYANEDSTIRQLTLDINELKVKIDMIKSKHNANKQLEEHIIKNEEEMIAISSQTRHETNEEDSSPHRQSIMPTILKLKKNKSRFLEID